MQKILLFYIMFAMGIFSPEASKPDKADILAALGRAEVYAEKAAFFYYGLNNSLYYRYKDGETDVSREEWDEKIVPLAGKVAMNLKMAMDEILLYMPDTPKLSDGWNKAYDAYYEFNATMDVFDDMDFYDSEYLQKLIRADSFLGMYLSVMGGRIRMAERGREYIKEAQKIFSE